MRVSREELEEAVGRHRTEIVAHCYRMLGALADAEDAAQDALARAWGALATFEGKASLRTWLFRIATNVCLDVLRARPRRELPMTSGQPHDPSVALPGPLERAHWVGPFPDPPDAELAARESIALAFIVLLQQLTPRQRAVLLARDVLGLEASEVAEHLDSSVPAVEGLLHRARTVMRGFRDEPAPPANRDLLARYLAAWTAEDVGALMKLLAEDATFSMPPQPAWFRGRDPIEAFIRARIFVGDRWELVPTRANGCAAFAVFRAGAPHAIHVLEHDGAAITSITCFLDDAIIERFVVR